MVLIHAFRCHPNDDDASPSTAFAFDDAEQTILAVASTNGVVSLYDCSINKFLFMPSQNSSTFGRAIPAVEVPTRTDASCVVVSLAWKPQELVWVMGMENGHVSLWSVSRIHGRTMDSSSSSLPSCPESMLQIKSLSTNKTAHRSAVVCLEWERDGSRLVSGDKAGIVTLWDIVDDDKLVAKSCYKKEGVVTDILWCCIMDNEGVSHAIIIQFSSLFNHCTVPIHL